MSSNFIRFWDTVFCELSHILPARPAEEAGTWCTMFYAYVLKSKKNGRLYIGSTGDLKRRFSEHNAGMGGEYTRNNRPFELVYYEAYKKYDLAKRAERFYKTGYGKEVLKSKFEM